MANSNLRSRLETVASTRIADARPLHCIAEGTLCHGRAGWVASTLPVQLENDMSSWRKQTADEVFSTDEITARLLDELPTWYLEDGWIRRKFKTSGWKATLMVVNTVGHLAEAAWHHPDLTVSYAFVTVKLMNHAAKGVTEKDFELAKKIEEVVMWQPGAGSSLPGTPDDPRFKYLKYA
jgi:4a-hydroxytetrahydrobiopterin dehydratase